MSENQPRWARGPKRSLLDLIDSGLANARLGRVRRRKPLAERRTRGGGMVPTLSEIVDGDARFESAGLGMNRAALRRKSRARSYVSRGAALVGVPDHPGTWESQR